jgi:hypothetical protein
MEEYINEMSGDELRSELLYTSKQLAAVTAQRDRLLAALEDVWEYLAQDTTPNWHDPIREEIPAAIAATKGIDNK